MFNVILATDNKNGIGYNGVIPWKCGEDLKLFKTITHNSILIMGRKTIEKLPYLENRTIWCITKNETLDSSNYKNKVTIFNSVEDVIEMSKSITIPIFIAGGGSIYNKFFSTYPHLINKVYWSIIKGNYVCDTFLKPWLHIFTINNETLYETFEHYILLKKDYKSSEKEYLNILKDVFTNGWTKKGRNGNTKSLFGKTLSFDLREGFPLLTTKKMFFRGIVEELLFFIRGDTDSNILSDKKINIWKGNTNRKFLDSIGKKNRKEGYMGPMYGYQWRYYNSIYDENTSKPKPNIDNAKYHDQLKNVIHQINTDPHSRRILLTDFNPLQATEGVLYPCHSIIIQFYVQYGYLDMFCYNRSSDLFHGLPFNIASSSLFLILIAKITGLIPRNFILSLGDSHIYESHYNVVKKQLERVPFCFPQLEICKDVNKLEDIENMEYSDFVLKNYYSYPTLKAPMIE